MHMAGAILWFFLIESVVNLSIKMQPRWIFMEGYLIQQAKLQELNYFVK